MFDTLADRLDGIFTRLRSRGRLGPKEVEEVAREIRVALLEADVNVRVVRGFIERVKERATGAEVAKSLSPAQQMIKIVHEELVQSLGGKTVKLTMSSRPPTVVMLAGLQGSGKTTAAAKLARLLLQDGKRPLLVAADLQRPAAIEQLRVLGQRVGVPVSSEGTDPVAVAAAGVKEAERLGRNLVIVDTAGRLQVDDELMDELKRVRDEVKPYHSLLVVDAMTGQEAVNVAETFDRTISLDGIVLTKLDGDARGGAALSVKEVVGKPILFAGTGERLEDFEVFHPERIASRVLGMGDVLTLIEKAEATFDAQETERAQEKLKKGEFTLEDFLDQMRQVKKLGPIGNLVGMLPGMPKEVRNAKIEDSEMARLEAIICSMTPKERRDPSVIDGSRRVRIANGSGTNTQAVNALVKQFRTVQQMVRQVAGTGPAATAGRAPVGSAAPGARGRVAKGKAGKAGKARAKAKRGGHGPGAVRGGPGWPGVGGTFPDDLAADLPPGLPGLPPGVLPPGTKFDGR